jgi:hypothetical protein
MNNKLYFIIIFLAFLVLILSGCSSRKIEQPPSEPDMIKSDEHSPIDSNIERSVFNWSNQPNCGTTIKFAAQGHDGDDESFLIDCIASTTYIPTGIGTPYNYVLVCDSSDKIDSTDRSSCKIWKLEADYDFSDPSASGSEYQIPGSNIDDPDACELLATSSTLHAWIYDAPSGYIRHFTWSIASDGTLSSFADDSTYRIDYGSYEAVEDICMVPTNSSGSSFNVLVLDANDPEIKTWYLSLSTWANHGARDISNFTFDSVTYKPICMCAMAWNISSSSYWNVYVAGRNTSNLAYDRIMCYHWDGADYDEDHIAVHFGSSLHYFPKIIGMDWFLMMVEYVY